MRRVLLTLLVLVPAVVAQPRDLRDDPFLDTLQARTFRWFWETTPASGLTQDRWPTVDFSSVAAIGFGLTAYGVGAERGYVTRAQAADRTLRTMQFLYDLPQGHQGAGIAGYKGFFYHFLNVRDGQPHGHRYERVELSSIDTALLMYGVLFVQQYFDRDTPTERAIRELADRLFRRVEWNWMQPRPPMIGMGWKPEQGFEPLDYGYRGMDEALFLYVMAIGSPTFAVHPTAWHAYQRRYRWGAFLGQDYVQFSPLFGYQYSFVWIDPRGLQDGFMRRVGIDYFEHSRRATLANRQFAIANDGGWKGYSADLWGHTAADGPGDTLVMVDGRWRKFMGYAARGASHTEFLDDGTLVPAAAGGSIPFAPEETIHTLKQMAARYGDDLFTRYGFLDSFNPSLDGSDYVPQRGRVVPGKGWFNPDYLGIDQGPILLMAENYRTGLIWRTMQRSPYLRDGLQRAGFTAPWLE